MITQSLDKSYSVDDVLVDIIKGVERKSFDAPTTLTLIVGGILICGEVISVHEWSDSGEDSSLEGENADEESSPEKQNSVEEISDKEDTDVRRFIHLKNAKIVYSTSQIPADEIGIKWRVKLTSVDGWSFSSFALVKGESKKHTIEVNGQKIEIS